MGAKLAGSAVRPPFDAVRAVSAAATAMALPERWHDTTNTSYEVFRAGQVHMGLQFLACVPPASDRLP